MSDNSENKKTESHDAGKVIGALLLGAVVGAGIGYLLASDEGKEIRKKVVDGVKDFVDDMKEKVNSRGNSKHEEQTTEKA
jgi:gas vesicle protein